MFRLPQSIQNLYIRLEGLLYQLFGIFGQMFGWLSQRFDFLSKLFGLKESQYFLEDEAQRTKIAEAESDMTTSAPQSPPTTSSTRRLPDANMDYYRKLAQPKKITK